MTTPTIITPQAAAFVEATRKLDPECSGRMWGDLFTTELTARSAQHVVTGRAVTYLACGLPLDRVLDALKLDAAGWSERVRAFEEWQAENRAAGARLSIRPIEVAS